jgi:hypothetical protein
MPPRHGRAERLGPNRTGVTMTDHSFLEAERARIFSGEDRDLYLHVGYFFTWYNHVEWSLTNVMALVMGEKDLSAFHVLVKRIDGQAKVQRLIELCKVKNRPIEQPLLDRLTHYKRKTCPLRNRLAHNGLCRDENKSHFYYMQIDRMPWKQLGMVAPNGLDQQAPDHIDAITLFEHGCWLHSFGEDLTGVIYCAIKQEPLGRRSPRSPLPRQHPT